MAKQGSVELRRRLFVLWCRLYIVLGAASLAGGVYLIFVAATVHGRVNSAPDLFIMGVGTVLILFGLWRAGLAIYHLNRLSGRKS